MKSISNYCFLIFILSVYLLIACNKHIIKQISVKIDQARIQGRAVYGLTFHDIRMKVYKNGGLNFLKSGFDTVFLLEQYTIDEGAYYGEIWSSKGNVKYRYQFGSISYDTKPFPRYAHTLLSNWDTAKIRYEELHYSNMIPSYRIFGTRAINDKGGFTIDTISFKEFFKVGRDNYDL